MVPPTPAERGPAGPGGAVDQREQGDVVRAATAALATDDPAPTASLPRVLSDAPVAVLLVDRTAGQVTYVNPTALHLAGDIAVPLSIEQWSRAAGLTDLDGTPLGATSDPLTRVAAGAPVQGQPVRMRVPQPPISIPDAPDDRGQVMWVTGFPLGADQDGDQLSLVVLLPIAHTATKDPDELLRALREQAVVATDICFTISDPHQPGNPLVWANPAFTRVTGYTFEEAVGRNCKFLQGPATDPAAVQEIVDGLGAGRSVSTTLLNYRADGTAFWNQVSISPVLDGTGRLVSFVGVQSDVTSRVLAYAEREAAHDAEREARQAAEAAQARMALMANATTQLSASLDIAELRHRLARLCVPLLADWVSIVQVDEHGTVTSTTSHHHDGEAMRPHLDAMEAEYLGRPFPPTAPNAQALASGAPVVVTGLDAEAMAPWSRGLRADHTLESLGTGSVLAIPLLTRGDGPWGVLALVRERGDGFADADLQVAQDLGRRAGQAFDNAQLYAQQAGVAEALQRALLPALPAVPRIDVAAHYSAASSAAVGGDFYDVVRLPGGRIGIVIGDVAGHDIQAAAAMGQLRGAIRTEAWATDAPDPATVLFRVDRLLTVLDLPFVATAAVLRATPPTGPGRPWTVEYANAGHPLVLARTPDGQVASLAELPGLLLGTGTTADSPARRSTTHHLPVGTQLIAYTDGLVELADVDGPGRDIDLGTTRLLEHLRAQATGSSAHDVCTLMHDLVPEPLDDIAVLVVELQA